MEQDSLYNKILWRHLPALRLWWRGARRKIFVLRAAQIALIAGEAVCETLSLAATVSRMAVIRGKGTPSEIANLLFSALRRKVSHMRRLSPNHLVKVLVSLEAPELPFSRGHFPRSCHIFYPLWNPRSVVRRRPTCRSAASQVAAIADAGSASQVTNAQLTQSLFCP